MRLQGVVRKIRITFCECAEMVGLWLAAEDDGDNQLGGFCEKSHIRLHGVLMEIETPARMFVLEPLACPLFCLLVAGGTRGKYTRLISQQSLKLSAKQSSSWNTPPPMGD